MGALQSRSARRRMVQGIRIFQNLRPRIAADDFLTSWPAGQREKYLTRSSVAVPPPLNRFTQHKFNVLPQGGNIGLSYLPDLLKIDAEVVMNEDVAKGRDLTPLDLRPSSLQHGRKTLTAFGEHLKVSQHRILRKLASRGMRLRRPPCPPRRGGRIQECAAGRRHRPSNRNSLVEHALSEQRMQPALGHHLDAPSQ